MLVAGMILGIVFLCFCRGAWRSWQADRDLMRRFRENQRLRRHG